MALCVMLAVKLSGRRGGLAASGRMANFPMIVLWAWERPDDLSSIDPRTAGIAYLAKTFQLRGRDVAVHPRMQPLEMPAGAALMAVVRIEVSHQDPPELNDQQREQIAEETAALASTRGVTALQIDF